MWKKSLLFCLILSSLVACGRSLSITIELNEPAPVASATPWPVLPTPTPVYDFPTVTLAPEYYSPTPTPGPMLPQAVLEKPMDFSPVLYGGNVFGSTFFLVLGGVGRAEWMPSEASVGRFAGEATYSLHDLQTEAKYFLWGLAPDYSPTCGVYTVASEADPGEAGFVAVLDGWGVGKRPVTELPANDPFYQQALGAWLSAQGVVSPEVGIMQVLRTDLEGDGLDEVFISAAHLDGSQHVTRAGDYAVVLMRSLVGAQVVTTLVAGDVYRSAGAELTFPRTYTLTNFIDLNQDGVQEVVVEMRHWEGFGAAIYQVHGGQVVEVLRAEC